MQFGIPRTLYDETHEQFRDTVARFIRAEVLPQYDSWEDAGRTPREIWLRAGEIGILGTSIPEECGGLGGDFLFDAVVLEELGRYGIAAPAWDMHSYIIAPFITAFGTEAQRNAWLPKMAEGSMISAIGLTEPGGGSDRKELRTTARRSGDVYIVNGAKTFITNGHIADYILLAVKTDPSAGARGVSLLWVDLNAPGVTRGRNLKKIGNKAQDTAELRFDDVEVPAANLIGGENEGWRRLMHGLNLERILLAASGVGQCFKIIEVAKEFMADRTAFGRKLTEFQAVSHKFADMQILTEAARRVTFHTADMLDAGKGAVMETAVAKTLGTGNNWKVADLGVQLMGGAGYVQGEMQRLFRDVRVGPIGGGSSEIMRNVIAARMNI